MMFIDPTPRQQTVVSTLAQRVRELQGIIGAFPDLFLWADDQGRVLDCYPGSEADLALPLDQVLGHRLRDVLDPEVAGRLQDAIAGVLRDHRMAVLEYTVGSAATSSSFEARIVPIAPDRVVVVVRNVTMERATEQHLRRAQKVEALGRLAGAIAHDFTNLLTVVQGCAVALRDEVSDTPAALATVDELLSATGKAGQLTRQLSTFSRRDVSAPRSVELNALVLDNFGLLATLVRTDVTLSLDLASDPIWVYADPVQLEQVLYNLCVNARDAMPTGGRLTIGVGHHPPGATHRGPAMVALKVGDSGTGMDAETLEHIFEPYFTTKRAAGTGLGLAMSYRIVSEAGGRIVVSSILGQGSVVTVLLPSHAPDETEEGSAGPAALPADGTETILLVEDEADVRNMIGRALRRHGYQVLEAPDTNSALHLYEAHRDAVRLVISDLVLPDGSGAELVFRLRHERPELPVALMSGYDPSEVGEDGLSRVAMVPGCVWLQKPLPPDQLLHVVRSTLNASGA